MRKNLLLFILGFNSKSDVCSQFNELLRNQFEEELNFDQRLFEYQNETKILWFKSGRSIQDISDLLRTKFNYEYLSYERIVVVCHSMGGLVAKRAILDLDDEKRSKVHAIVFFATPHTGSSVAALGKLFSNKQLSQLTKGSDFVELVAREWQTKKLYNKIDSIYVAAADDGYVSRQSSVPERSAKSEFVQDKDHSSLISPTDTADLSFLIVMSALKNHFVSANSDIDVFDDLLKQGDTYGVCQLLANRGRSWVEGRNAEPVVNKLAEFISVCDENSLEFIWASYLQLIGKLFLHGNKISLVIDDTLIASARIFSLHLMFEAERMEFARKSNDREGAIKYASHLLPQLAKASDVSGAGEAYSTGVANFLMGNFLRAGGRYVESLEFTQKAVVLLRPTLLSHQIELAHCKYSASICIAALGREADSVASYGRLVGYDDGLFAHALLKLADSHASWLKRDTGSAVEIAKSAAEIFQAIQFPKYAERAQSLSNHLALWQRLELGAKPEEALSRVHFPEDNTLLKGLLGFEYAWPSLKSWLATSKPSKVLGLLQFANAFSEKWADEVEEFEIPAVLILKGGEYIWQESRANSLSDANKKLRKLMNIDLAINVPLIVD